MAQRSLADFTGYNFADPALLRQSLTHRSFGVPHNERLEFLGDAVLNCAVAALVYDAFTEVPEGDLSRLRASLVNQQSLFEIAQEIDLGNDLKLGEGELKSGGARRPSILADALEALIGGVFLDGGYAAAHAVVRRLIEPRLRKLDPQSVGKDAKTLLQEYLQARRFALPRYSVVATAGEAHEQNFRVECAIAELSVRTEGEGSSRRAAEQIAARRAYDSIAERK